MKLVTLQLALVLMVLLAGCATKWRNDYYPDLIDITQRYMDEMDEFASEVDLYSEQCRTGANCDLLADGWLGLATTAAEVRAELEDLDPPVDRVQSLHDQYLQVWRSTENNNREIAAAVRAKDEGRTRAALQEHESLVSTHDDLAKDIEGAGKCFVIAPARLSLRPDAARLPPGHRGAAGEQTRA